MHASQGRIQKSSQPAEPAPKCFCLRFLVMIFTKNEEQILALERRTVFFGERRIIQRSACFTLLFPTAATTNRGFSRITQGVDRFCSPNRPDPISYTRYCRMRNCFSITVYVSRVHPSNENQSSLSWTFKCRILARVC